MITVTYTLVCKNREQQYEIDVTASHHTYKEALKKAKKLADEVSADQLVMSAYVKSVKDE